MTDITSDITSRADIEAVLRRFYGAAFTDPLIGTFFTEIAGLDLEEHLPRVTRFWAAMLLGEPDFRGNVFAPHRALDRERPLTGAHFGRWVQLWHASVDGMFAGPVADKAKAAGERVAVSMLRRLGETDPGSGGTGGFIPLSAVALRGVRTA